MINCFSTSVPFYNLEESAYGHYYQLLIVQAISKISNAIDKIDAYLNYLTEFANYLSIHRSYHVNKEQFETFHKWFCDEYAIGSSFSDLTNFNFLIENFNNIGIIENINGLYSFHYKYMYYFFVAKFLANNIGETEIRKRISEMCKRLYRSEFAHIILFLTHHTKDHFVLQEILSNAKFLFSKYEPTRLEDDIVAFNNLLDEVPKLVLDNRSVSEVRENYLKKQDENELSEKSESKNNIYEEIPDWQEEKVELDIFSSLNVAIKTIEILGQIMRNYHGSLKRNIKLDLGKETYFLGLRALHPLFRLLEEHIEYLVDRITTSINKKKIKDRDRVEQKIEKFLFFFCSGLAFAFIKKIADSVGSEHLSETFKEIEQSHTFPSIKLIDMAIKLEFYREFPFNEVRHLKKEYEKNIMALTILKTMVLEHLYMFETKEAEKQKICSLLGIPVQTQRLIDIKSAEIKQHT